MKRCGGLDCISCARAKQDPPEGCSPMVAAFLQAWKDRHRTPKPAPTFQVRIFTDYQGCNPKLGWGHAPLTTWTARCGQIYGNRALALFDCYPVDMDKAAPAPRAPRVELSIELARDMLHAFRGGIVRDETIAALQDAIQKAR